MRLAYLVSQFPTLSETFVVREVLEIQRLGHEVQVYSLKSNPDAGYDAAAEGIVRETEYSPFFLSARLLWANLRTAARRPLPDLGDAALRPRPQPGQARGMPEGPGGLSQDDLLRDADGVARRSAHSCTLCQRPNARGPDHQPHLGHSV